MNGNTSVHKNPFVPFKMVPMTVLLKSKMIVSHLGKTMRSITLL